MYYDENGNEVELYDIEPGSFYKKKKTDKIWWKKREPGVFEDGQDFTFDKIHIYNTYTGYHRLPKSKREIFDLENPYLALRFNNIENVSEKVREAFKEEMGYYPTDGE